jgi:ketosteroid isomerase-like protein
MPAPELEALRRIYAAISTWDVDEWARSVTHDFELCMPETLPRTFATLFRDHVDGQWADPDNYIGSDDALAVYGRMRGRAIATGKSYEVHFVHVWMLSDGMPSRCRSYFDTAPVTEALSAE